MGDKPSEATKLIKFLNSKNRWEFEELEIEDITKTILEVRKVLIKINPMRQLEEKCHIMEICVHKFFTKLEPLYKEGRPNLLVINDKLSMWYDYNEKIMIKARENLKVVVGRFSMTGKAFSEALAFDLNIQYAIKSLFITKLTFAKYTEVEKVYIKLLNMIILSEQ